MERVKALLGIVCMSMAMGELATGFWAYPVILKWCLTVTEWWATYLPEAMLFNSLTASVLLMFYGVRMLKANSFFTEKQSHWLDGKAGRWLERRRYGYCKSDYILKKEAKENE